MKAIKCEYFCNAHCSYDCPNFQVDAFEEHWDLPASEVGLERVKCKDCEYNIRHCDCTDCYLYCSDDCPVHETIK